MTTTQQMRKEEGLVGAGAGAVGAGADVDGPGAAVAAAMVAAWDGASALLWLNPASSSWRRDLDLEPADLVLGLVLLRLW